MSSPALQRVPSLGLAAAVAAVLAALLGGLLLLGPLPTAFLTVGLAFLVLAVVLPWEWMPGFVLASHVLVPVLNLPVDTGTGGVSPALAAGLVFAARSLLERRPIQLTSVSFFVLLFSVWLLIDCVLTGHQTGSLLWTANFGLLVTPLVLWAPASTQALRHARNTWIVLSAVLALYGCVEEVLSTNPLLQALYESGSNPIKQGWSSYRITTTLGHPLVNGIFFAVGAALALGAAMEARSRVMFAAFGLSTLAVVLTQSRSAALGLGVGVLLYFGLLGLQRGPRRSGAFLRAVLLVLILLGGTGLFAASGRLTSDEASGSTSTRVETYVVGEQLALDHLPWGAGPGEADNVKRKDAAGDPRRGVESSWLQIVISTGIPGSVLLGLVFVVALGRNLTRNTAALASLSAYLATAALFNLIETVRPALIFLGVLLALCATTDRVPEAKAAHPTSHRALVVT